MTREFRDALEAACRRPEYWREMMALELSDAVAEAMERQGLTRAELARRLNMSPSRASRILAGEDDVSLATVARIAITLGLRPLLRLVPADAGPDSLPPDARSSPRAWRWRR